MGRPKLLLPFGDGTVLGAVLAALAGGGARRICVVARPDDPGLAAWLGALAAGEVARRLSLRRRQGARPRAELHLALNPDPERGMLSSVLSGLGALAAGGAADEGASRPAPPLLVCPGDLPTLSPATVAAVLGALAAPGAGLAVPVHRGRRGHPLAIAADLLAEIPDLDPTIGLRHLRLRHPDRVTEVPVDDPGCVRDIDTPGEYRELGRPGSSHRA
jgi:CTP:molybdopterin cytidylyltransferase MocA